MTFESNPPLTDPAAPYHIDLLSLLAGLRHGPAGYFYDVRTLLQAWHGHMAVVGGPQAKAYMEAATLTRAVADAVSINPLFALLELRPTRLHHLAGERLFYSIEVQPENSLAQPVCRITGNTFCTSLIAEHAWRIWMYQTVTAMQARADQERQRTLLPDRHAGSTVPFPSLPI